MIGGFSSQTSEALVLCDLAYTRGLLEHSLRRLGVRARAVETVPAAVARVRDGFLDVVVVDLCRGESAAEDFLLALREEGLDLPVFVIAVLQGPDTLRRLRSLGARKFFPRPLDVFELESAVGRFLGLDQALTGSAESEPFSYDVEDWCDQQGEIAGSVDVEALRDTAMQRLLSGAAVTPQVLERLLKESADERTSARRVSEIVSRDPALASNLLRVVNSSCYGFSQRIASIHQAVVILGFRAVRNMASGLVASGAVTGGPDSTARGESTVHSFRCALAARMLAQFSQNANPEECFAAGLLHDLAIPIIGLHLPQQMQAIKAEVRSRGMSHLQAERTVLGVDHAWIGGWLCKKWSFPARTVESVSLHHEPEQSRQHQEETSAVHIAEVIATRLGPGYEGEEGDMELSPHAVKVLNLSPESIERVSAETAAQSSELVASLTR